MKTPTDEINDSVRDTKSTGSFNTATNVLDDSWWTSVSSLLLQLTEVLGGQMHERGDNGLAQKLGRLSEGTKFRCLNLELALPETKFEHLLDRGRARLGNLVLTSDAKVAATFTDKDRDVSGTKEDQCDWEIERQGDVEAVVPVELDV